MFWYIAFALTPTILYFLVPRRTIFCNENANRRIYLVLCGSFLFFMIAFRHYSVGSEDSYNYYRNWNTISELSFSDFLRFTQEYPVENGYLFTVWLLSRVFVSPQWVFIFSGILFSVAVCVFLYNNCVNLPLGMTMFICLGLYTFMVQGLRQAIAMSICFFAIEFCKKRNFSGFILFLILIVLATQYHRTAIVFLPVYFLYGRKINSLWSFLIIVIYTLFLIIAPDYLTLANEYVERDYSGTFDSGGYVALAVYVVILLLGFFTSSKEERDNDFYSFYVWLVALGLVVYTTRYYMARIAERVSFYYMVGQIILLPQILQKFEPRFKMIISSIVIVLCIALFVYRLNGSGLVPYKFFWQ